MPNAGHLAFVNAADLGSPPAPGIWRVGFGQPPADWMTSGESQDFIGPFVLEKRHPLLLGVSLGGVVWSGAVPLRTEAVRPLVSTHDRVLIGTAAAGPAELLCCSISISIGPIWFARRTGRF